MSGHLPFPGLADVQVDTDDLRRGLRDVEGAHAYDGESLFQPIHRAADLAVRARQPHFEQFHEDSPPSI